MWPLSIDTRFPLDTNNCNISGLLYSGETKVLVRNESPNKIQLLRAPTTSVSALFVSSGFNLLLVNNSTLDRTPFLLECQVVVYG